MSGPRLWEVAIPVPLRRTFVYRYPGGLPAPEPGCRVLVPFGRRRLVGYLLKKAGEGDRGFKVRDVIELLDAEPSIPERLLAFLVEAAGYYMHPIGEVIRSALPPGIDPRERGGALEGPRISSRVRRVAVLDGDVRETLEEMARRAPARAAVLERIAGLGRVPVAELKGVAKDPAGHVRRLAKDGLIRVEEESRPADPFWRDEVARDAPVTLNDEQAQAVDAVVGRIESGGYEGFLLNGITGSGKTEVYLRAVEAAAARGRGALVLVPEITLTPQLVRRYRARFGDNLAVWHSGLSDRERYEQWRALRTGQVRVAIGVRSAVFAPVRDLGLIVVDEEHDGSFKQEKGFAYNARDLALLRAARGGAVAILGSATPSMETRYNAESGKLTALVLSARATRQPLPEVEVVDLRSHRSGPGGQRVISGPLHRAISQTLERGEQSILFINRRGFSPSMVCADCGETHSCDSCAVSMTLHRRPKGLVCHYCGARRPIPDRCASCGGENLEAIGTGTQKVEELLADLFPEARVARLDRDVASTRGAQGILERLRTGEIDILVGTQMVTKGHDFPRVTLVGVLLGDVGLHMPDFRASERTFQLLTQVAGRAGRSSLGGRAIIQTYSPGHHAVDFARNHDYDGFARIEAGHREDLGYPPFGRLAAVRISGIDGPRTEAAAREIAVAIRDACHARGNPPVELLGPVPAPITMVKGRYRWRILLRGKRQDQIRALLADVSEVIEGTGSGVTARIDVDPVSML